MTKKKEKNVERAENRRARFIHRELSWLAFNERVLEEAEDRANPLGERLKFVAIFASNIDEFFMVRLAGIRRLMDAHYRKPDDYGYFPDEIFAEIKNRIHSLNERLYADYRKAMRELGKHRISLRRYNELNRKQKQSVKNYFDSTVFPVMTPMAVDQGHPFPVLPSKTLTFVLRLEKDGQEYFAILPVPAVVPRIYRLPTARGTHEYILIEEIIRNNISVFFRGYTIVEHSLFRVSRDSDLNVREEYAEDLLKAIETEIRKRPKARAVWLEVESDMSGEMIEKLCEEFEMPPADVMKLQGELDLTFLFSLTSSISGSDLFYPGFTPAQQKTGDMLEQIRAGDFLVHVPFESFEPVVNFVRNAARDPKVLALKMTLYRTSPDSSFIKALKTAASNGKQVTVLVEIKARFDEENNIVWAKELEKAGCHVIYGIPGLKIHSKIALVVRNEDDGIRRYIHLSTGNYNEKTANIYTDIGLLTCNEEIARDVSDVFNVISGYSIPPKWKKIVSAPYNLRNYFNQMIDNEIALCRKYGGGEIFAKMNSLADNKIIEKLYDASCNGVKIRLLVRGICCLIPGVKGMSENIEVRSIVGRFLEHSRIFCFRNQGDHRVYLSSADWMTRNFDRRIELLFEIEKPELSGHLIELFEQYWQDNCKSRVLRSSGIYERTKNDKPKLNTQEYLIRYYSANSTSE